MSFGSILEWDKLYIQHYYNLSIRSVLEWLGMREFHHNYMSFGSILEWDRVREFNAAELWTEPRAHACRGQNRAESNQPVNPKFVWKVSGIVSVL